MRVRKFQAYEEFSAQSKTVSALMSMYSRLESADGVRVELTPIVVFLAFSIESYLNSIGARHISFWDEVERNPWKSKVIILHKAVGKSPNWGEDPLQFAVEIFQFRDKLAHGKPERALGPIRSDSGESDKDLYTGSVQPEWYKKITREWVMLAKARFEALMGYMADLYGLHKTEHLISSTGGILTIEE